MKVNNPTNLILKLLPVGTRIKNGTSDYVWEILEQHLNTTKLKGHLASNSDHMILDIQISNQTKVIRQNNIYIIKEIIN